MKMKKSLIAMLMTTVFLTSMLGPLLTIQEVSAVAPDDPLWYTTVEGVLATDYYTLYPYNKSSTTIGLSKYAEMIDNYTNVGLEYAYTGGATGRDPFAAPPGTGLDLSVLPKNVWINGWFIDITYMHNSWGLRNLWAGALFADLSDYGKPWMRVTHLNGSSTTEAGENFKCKGLEIDATIPMMTGDPATLNPAYTGSLVSSALMWGGRKTNATAYTDPMQVLYHGPRKFVAILVTWIADYDEDTKTTLPIIRLQFTVIFDKVKKQVIMLKDVKLLAFAKAQLSGLPVTVQQTEIDWVHGVLTANPLVNDTLNIDGGVLVQFSDRQEWDLGKKTVPGTLDYSSYAHYYTDGVASNDTEPYDLSTVYDTDWTLVTTLPARTIVNGITVNAWGPEPDMGSGEYDMAQIISNDKKFVGWAAHWPSCSDWTVDGLYGHSVADVTWWRAMKADDPHYIDHYTGTEPWRSPLVTGEWDFMLSGSANNQTGTNTGLSVISDVQFRGVSVYGVTDLHDGADEDFIPYSPSNHNVIDREVCYMLDEVFKPWDLVDALGADTAERWVQKEIGDGETEAFQLRYGNMYPDNTRPTWPNVTKTDFITAPWDAYGNWPERVLVDGVLMKPTSVPNGADYFMWEDPVTHFMWVNFTTAPPEGIDYCENIKILFSTHGCSYEWLTIGRESAVIDSAGAAMVATKIADKGGTLKLSGFDMEDAYAPVTPSIFSPFGADLTVEDYRDAAQAYNEGRTGLKDDYCSHENIANEEWYNGVPIASASIINVGGPSASLTAEYFNDFDDVFATLGVWTPDPHNAWKIMPLTCWSLNREDFEHSGTGIIHAYMPEYADGVQTIGYGVISTYRDINGTVGLNIWGYTGQDTYFTTWALLHSDVLALFEANIVCGVTSIILQFNYTLHPTDYCFVTLVEALGTISEYNVQAVFTDHVSLVTEGEHIGEHLFSGNLPPDWFRASTPTSHYVEDWDNWPVATWITDKYPTIHPDP